MTPRCYKRVVPNPLGLSDGASPVAASSSNNGSGTSRSTFGTDPKLTVDDLDIPEPRLALRRPARGSWSVTSGEKLCLSCGLCCDGTLFDNVQLGPGDDAKKLKALGLPVTVSRAKPPVTLFAQPCAALCADRTCGRYADRPQQCRSFECSVYKNAEAGRVDFAAALRLVKQARRRADQIRQLLRTLGDTDEHRSLSDRFRRTQRRLESSCTNPADGETFAELSLAVHDFNLLKHAKFYTRADAP